MAAESKPTHKIPRPANNICPVCGEDAGKWIPDENASGGKFEGYTMPTEHVACRYCNVVFVRSAELFGEPK